MRTGKPIVYTSADSVLQIACHEEIFGLERLYDLCRLAYRLVQPYKIARVIARPFVGTKAGHFERVAAHRHDFAVPAHEPTLLDNLVAAGDRFTPSERLPIFSPTAAFPNIIPPPGSTGFSTPRSRL